MELAPIVSQVVSEAVSQMLTPRHHLSEKEIEVMAFPLPPGWVRCCDFDFHRETLTLKKDMSELSVYPRSLGKVTKREKAYITKGLRFLEQLIGNHGERLDKMPKELAKGLGLTYKKSVIRDIKPYASYARSILNKIGSAWTVDQLSEVEPARLVNKAVNQKRSSIAKSK